MQELHSLQLSAWRQGGAEGPPDSKPAKVADPGEHQPRAVLGPLHWSCWPRGRSIVPPALFQPGTSWSHINARSTNQAAVLLLLLLLLRSTRAKAGLWGARAAVATMVVAPHEAAAPGGALQASVHRLGPSLRAEVHAVVPDVPRGRPISAVLTFQFARPGLNLALEADAVSDPPTAAQVRLPRHAAARC